MAMTKSEVSTWCRELAHNINNDPVLLKAFIKTYDASKEVINRKPGFTLAKRMKQAIKDKDCYQTDVARAAGTTPTAVNFWLTGASLTMEAGTAIKVARFLNVSVEWLILGEEKDNA
jgi:DNA-binding XRE family transcriptional regulator